MRNGTPAIMRAASKAAALALKIIVNVRISGPVFVLQNHLVHSALRATLDDHLSTMTKMTRMQTISTLFELLKANSQLVLNDRYVTVSYRNPSYSIYLETMQQLVNVHGEMRETCLQAATIICQHRPVDTLVDIWEMHSKSANLEMVFVDG